MSQENQIDIAKYQEQVKSMINTILYFESLPEDQAVAYAGGLDVAQEEAQKYLNKPTIKQLVCPPLVGIVNDVFSVSQAITPTLITATIAGTIAIPLNPLIYAWIALIIFRAGIGIYCKE